MKKSFFLFLILLFPLSLPAIAGQAKEGSPGAEEGMPVLVYHRFGPTVVDSMTVTTTVFEAHLKYLQENGFKVVRLRELLDHYLKNGSATHPRMVAITADDGHISIYTDALPLLKKYRLPMTLFLYPSAISNASYAMTWDQLRELKETGLFDFQSHTYWHPNFKKDQERLKPGEYEKSVEVQLNKPRAVLEKKFNCKVDMLAWPFGIHNAWLMTKAAEAGYIAAFTIERHHVNPTNQRMALPRYLMTNADRGKAFERIVGFNSTGR